MTDIYELELRGCSPDPLMSYLKALGVFRLVSEQVDPDLRGWWAERYVSPAFRLWTATG